MFKLWSGDEKESKLEKSEKDNTNQPSEGKVRDSDDAASEALTNLAKVMRLLGRHSFDLNDRLVEDIEKEFERWAMHVSMGAPVSEGGEPLADGRRDWGGLNRFVSTHRQEEKKYVTEGLGDLRDVLLTFTQTIGQAVMEDQEADRNMDEHIGSLQSASEASSAEEMKQALMTAVDGLSQLLEERKQRQQAYVETLGSKLKKVQEELGQARKEMTLDPLTKLYNRAALDIQADRVAGLSLLSRSPASLIMFDIDHFKHVNDTFGHRAGDAILQQFADRLVSVFLRKSDFIARYGGEEMMVLQQGDDASVSERIVERFLESVRSKPFVHEGIEIPITTSAGLAEIIPGESVASWVERADRALYQAKETGRDRVCLASTEAIPA